LKTVEHTEHTPLGFTFMAISINISPKVSSLYLPVSDNNGCPFILAYEKPLRLADSFLGIKYFIQQKS
jgi:hypothetical protein